MLAETRQECVSDVSDSALQRQKLARQTACGQFIQKEANEVFGDLLARGVGLARRQTRARFIRFDDGDNFGGIDHGEGSTDAVKWVSDGDGLAMRRQGKGEDIAEFPDTCRMMPVGFNHDLLGQLQIGRAIANGRREVDASLVRDVTGFDHGKIDLAEESLEKLLRAVRKMDVREIDLPLIDRAPARFLSLERHAKADRVCLHKVHVNCRPSLGTAEDSDLKRLAALVKSSGPLCERSRNRMRTAGVGESTNAQGSAVRNQLGGFLSR